LIAHVKISSTKIEKKDRDFIKSTIPIAMEPMITNNTLFGIELPTQSKEQVLEKIKEYINLRKEFCHIVSLNPENLVAADKNEVFKDVVKRAQIRIIDGVGVVIAARLKHIAFGERYPGVDLMSDLIKIAHTGRSRVLLIGGGPKVAEKAAECQKKKYPDLQIFSFAGISNITDPDPQEENEVFSIVTATKPHIVFVAFGSPYQEIWIDKNRHKFAGMVVAGVGGAFDFLSGNVFRAPKIVRMLGFEWLFRLFLQPWRLKRQLQLPYFFYLTLLKRKED
jgi:N-acetylglucosaminyldiphosphoundecaprenol N-acetyl-beta-D-mannosaminyltransferase